MLYLGHVVSADGILPDPEKIKLIKEYPTSSNEKEVKSFVAFANYYRKFIPNFAEKAFHLNKLGKKDVKFKWDDNCQRSFQELKNAIITPPVLQYPDFSKENEFILHTDASGYAIGAVLSNSNGKPVAYASRCLNKAESSYATIEKELLAIVWATKHFRPYLYGRHFKIKTDHKPLIYLFNMKDPSSRLLKFRLALEEYHFTVEYIKGKENTAADALSRIKITSKELKEMNECLYVIARKMANRQMTSNNDNGLINSDSTDKGTDQPRVVELTTMPKEGVELQIIKENELNKLNINDKANIKESKTLIYLKKEKTLYIKLVSPSQMTRRAFVRELGIKCKEWNINKITVRKNKNNNVFVKNLANEIQKTKEGSIPSLFIINDVIKITDKDEKKVILNDFHILPTSGHAGERKMYNNIKRRYFWSGLEEDIKNYVQKCEKCQKEKYSRYTKEPMTITTTATEAFQKIFMDVVRPLERDEENFSYILTIQCELTKYIEAYPMKTKSTKEVAEKFVNNFILRFGIPEIIATDRGTEFISTTFQEVCNCTAYK